MPDSTHVPRYTRTKWTESQLSVLRRLYATDGPIPSERRRDHVAACIGTDARKVQVWFQNQRQRRTEALMDTFHCMTRNEMGDAACLEDEHVSSVAVLLDVSEQRVRNHAKEHLRTRTSE